MSSSEQVTPNFWTDPASGIPYYFAVQTPEREVASLNDLQNTPVSTAVVAGGTPVPGVLGNVATLARASVPTNANQTNIQPVYEVYASVQGRDLGSVAGEIDKIVADLQKQLAPGSSIQVVGQIDSMNGAFRNLGLGILFAAVPSSGCRRTSPAAPGSPPAGRLLFVTGTTRSSGSSRPSADRPAQLDVLRQQKAYQRVVAPFDGVITQRNVDVGSLVQADPSGGTFLFTLMQRNVIRTQVFVSQDQAFGLRPGVEAVVRVPEIPDRSSPGKVTRLADALQPGTRTLLTEFDVPNPDEALAVGIYCTVELRIPRKTPSLLIPSDALIFNRDGPQVALVEEGVVRIRKVSVARDLGTSLELRDGVKKGDMVVFKPGVSLREGNRVHTAGN